MFFNKRTFMTKVILVPVGLKSLLWQLPRKLTNIADEKLTA